MRTLELPGKKPTVKKPNENELKLAAAYGRGIETPSTEQQRDPYAVREIYSIPGPLYRPKP